MSILPHFFLYPNQTLQILTGTGIPFCTGFWLAVGGIFKPVWGVRHCTLYLWLQCRFYLIFCSWIRHAEIWLASAFHFVLIFDRLWVAFLSRFEVSGTVPFISGFNADLTSFFWELNETLGNVTGTGNPFGACFCLVLGGPFGQVWSVRHRALYLWLQCRFYLIFCSQIRHSEM